MNGLKPIARPALWIGLWSLAVLLVWVLCLMPPPLLPPLPANSDKLEHLLAYAVLAAAGVQLWRGARALATLGCGLLLMGLLLMGLLIELAQGWLTSTRAADPWDMLANSLGVLLGLALAATPAANLLLRWQPR